MSEENIPQQPIPQQPIQEVVIVPPVPVVKSKPSGDWKGRRRGLEDLPIDVKKDMEDIMRKNNPHIAKKYMIEKYGKQYPIFEVLSKMAFYKYWKRHKVEMAKELELQKQAAEVAPEIKDVIERITDPDISLSDKRAALNALFVACDARNKLLLERQTNFLDPHLEKLILENRKEQHAILKTISNLSDQLSKDSEKDWLSEAQTLVQVILSSVYNSYKLTHTDQSNFSMFSSTLGENLTAILKNYKSAKEQLKKENS